MNLVAGIIFDCDGVLFESRMANLAYYNTILAAFGEQPVDPADIDKAHLCHTAASPEVFRVLLGEERSTAALDAARRLDYHRFIPHMQPEPGMALVIAELSRHFPLAVATNRGSSMHEILAHFRLVDYFRAVVTSRDVPRPKPHPDMLLEATRRLDLEPEQILFVGDSELDQAAAAAAGIRFAAYRTNLQADLQIASHRQLLNLFCPGT